MPGKSNKIEVDFSSHRTDCEKLIEDATKSSHKIQEIEGHIFWARFAAMERNLSRSDDNKDTTDGLQTLAGRLKDDALTRLDLAEALSSETAAQASSVAHEIEQTRKMLRDTVFYTPVSSEEMRSVVMAMASDFRGTGHWYRCTNGHPFTVRECGMPMETSRCPQCGETVGGLEHESAEGVTHANDIEQRFGGMDI